MARLSILKSSKGICLHAGTIEAYAGASAPSGWLLCQGQPLSRTTYSKLFEQIGTSYGVGDGSSTFNIPDLRGEFVRGSDNGRGIDSGRVHGTLQGTQLKLHTHGVGSLAAAVAAVPHTHPAASLTGTGAHTHTEDAVSPYAASPAIAPGPFAAGNVSPFSSTPKTVGTQAVPHTHTATASTDTFPHTHSFSGTTGAEGASPNIYEMRPVNIALNFIIKT